MLRFARSAPTLFANSRRLVATMAQKRIDIDIVSDTVCPWCYVGKRRLEKAMTAFKSQPEGKDVTFNITWKPFQLNPDRPQNDEGHDKMLMYYEKFGKSRTDQMVPQMTETFADEGLGYSMGGKTGSTLNSHRLIWWALQKGGPAAQDRLVEQLFKAYFTEEKFINDPEVLLAAAVGAGFDSEEAAVFIADPQAGKTEITKELREARLQAITGVPNFTIGGKVQLSGAQPPSSFQEAFAKVVEAA